MRMTWTVCLVISVGGIFTPVVEIGQGKLRGLRSVYRQHRYYGIPYATSKRYQPPQDPPKWDGVFNAVNPFGSCAQAVSIFTLGKENCLHLDVYTPETAKRGNNLPVFVFIHGGAYYYGSKGHYDPAFLVAKNIVAVIINYRLGALGFLCLNDTANLGLKDQVAALKWIRDNIIAFGGDPDNVTLAGQSSGASAAALLFLSEHSKGLFHKAILMSGTPLAPWSFNLEFLRDALNDAKKISGDVKEADVYNIFANASINDILSTTRDTSTNLRGFKYTPCVDTGFYDPFFRDKPYDIIKSGKFNKVPIMIGLTDAEGKLFYGLNDDKTLAEWNENLIDRLPSVFSWCSITDKRMIASKFRSHYFANGNINKAAVKGIVDIYSDFIVYSTIDAFSNLITEVSDKPVYQYLFTYKGNRNFASLLFGRGTNVRGATHSDDIFYIFKPAGVSFILSHKDKLFIDKLTTMMTNFMKFGDPTPRATKLLPLRWPPASAAASHTLQLDHHLRLVNLTSHRESFFLKMLCTYGQPGFVPCESAAQCNLDAK